MTLTSNAFCAQIHEAVKAGNKNSVVSIIKSSPEAVNSRTKAGSTPLHFAAGIGNIEIIRFLIANGAEVDASTSDGYTPLHWAAYMNSPDAVRYLVKKGAVPEKTTASGKTPLQIAFEQEAGKAALELLHSSTLAYTESVLDSRTVKGRKALDSELAEKAEKVIEQLVRSQPESEAVRFAYGMIKMSLGKHSEAVKQFRAVTSMNPQNGRAFAELGTCLAAEGDIEGARLAFNEALKSNPSPVVRAKLENFLREPAEDVHGQMVNKWHIFGRANFAWFDDSNVNVGPDSDIVEIAPVTFGTEQITSLEVDESSQPEHAQGFLWSAGISTVYDVGARGDWDMSSDFSYYQNSIPEASEYESLFYQIAAGPRKLTKISVLQVPLRVGHILSGGEELVDIYGVSLMFAHLNVKHNLQLAGKIDAELRDYDNDAGEDSEYFLTEGSVTRLIGEKQHNIGTSLSVFHDTSDTAGHTGATCLFGGSYVLPISLTVYGNIRYTYIDYANRVVLAPEDRNDYQYQLTSGVNGMISGQWGYNVAYQYSDNQSTFDLYDYDRSLITAGTFVSF